MQQEVDARRIPELTFAPLWPSVFKVLLAALGMGILVAVGKCGIASLGLGPRAADALGVFALIPAGAVAYGILLWFLRIDGREELAALVRKKLPSFAK